MARRMSRTSGHTRGWRDRALGVLDSTGRRLGASRVAERVRRHPNVAALLLYLVTALYTQQHALAHMSTTCACYGTDPTLDMWSLRWWPYAITHGHNPFVTDRMWAPLAINIAPGTTIPLPSLVAWPLTALTSVTASYNVLMVIAPILSGWCAYRLCRYLTGAPWASIVGGYLFGFSTFALGELLGHMQLVFTFAAPLVVLLSLQRLDDVIGVRRYVVAMTLTLIAQLLCGTEIELTMTMLGAVALAAGWVFCDRERRQRIVDLLPPLAGAYALTVVVCSPYLYYLIRGPANAVGRGAMFPADALSFVVPTLITHVGGHRFVTVSTLFLGSPSEQGTYVGVVVVLIVITFLIQRRRTAAGSVLASVLVVAVVWSLGRSLYIDGHPTLPLPWRLFDRLPGLDEIIPIRIGEYIALICALIVTLWLSERTGARRWRWPIALVAVAMLVPNPDARFPGTSGPPNVFEGDFHTPAFFTDGTYRRYLRPGEVIVPLPYGPDGPALVWQADADMYFREASGRLYLPAEYGYDTFVQELLGGNPVAVIPRLIRPFAARHRVGAFVLRADTDAAYGPVLQRVGLRPLQVDGVIIYNVPRSWWRTPAPPLPIPAGCAPDAVTCPS